MDCLRLQSIYVDSPSTWTVQSSPVQSIPVHVDSPVYLGYSCRKLGSSVFRFQCIYANFSGCHAGVTASPAEDSEAEGGTRVVPRPAQQRRRQESLIGVGLANFPQSYQHFNAK